MHLAADDKQCVYTSDFGRFSHICTECDVPYVCNAFHTSDQKNSREYICHVYLNAERHLNVHWCTLKCILGMWLYFQKSKSLSSKQHYLNVMRRLCLFTPTKIYCRNESILTWWIQQTEALPEVVKQRPFGIIAILQVRKTSLTAHSQAFLHVLKMCTRL